MSQEGVTGLSGNFSRNPRGLSGNMPGVLHFGVPGPPGPAPVRGKDYWTDEDKQEIISEVLSSEPIVKLREDIDAIRADMNYKPISITAISNNIGTVELGTAVAEMMVTWKLNKAPAAQALGGENIAVDVRSMAVSMDGRTSVTLTVTDEREAKASRSTGYNAYNGIYYGAAAAPGAVDSAFILSLTRTLSNTKGRTITVTAAAGERIWYALPSRLGSCSFAVGGFTGGFELVAVISFTNASGYTEEYNVYASARTGLGETKVVVS